MIEIITSILTGIGLIIALLVFIRQSRAQIKMQQAEYVYRLVDKYDAICLYKSQHPEVLSPKDGRERRAYEHFAEMTLGFIEISSYMTFVDKTFSKKVYEDFIMPMIRLEVLNNAEIMKTFAEHGEISDITKKIILEILKK